MFFPEWFTYFGKYFLKSRFLGQRKPLLAGFKITYDCNLTCRHCPFWKLPKPEPLNFEAVKKILTKFHDLGTRIIIFEGGEALLWKDRNYTIYDVLAEARKLFFSVGVTTNGTHPLDLPTHVIWISLDGLEKTHDSIRGESVFSRVINNIQQSTHPNLYVNMNINRINVQEIPDLVKYLQDKVKGVTFQFQYPFEKQDDLVLSPQQRIWVLEELIKLKRAGYSLATSYSTMEALKENKWRCHDWMLANADPTGQINLGCYVRNRGTIQCRDCGFAAHTEISLAYDLNLSSIWTGKQIFHYGFNVS